MPNRQVPPRTSYSLVEEAVGRGGGVVGRVASCRERCRVKVAWYAAKDCYLRHLTLCPLKHQSFILNQLRHCTYQRRPVTGSLPTQIHLPAHPSGARNGPSRQARGATARSSPTSRPLRASFTASKTMAVCAASSSSESSGCARRASWGEVAIWCTKTAAKLSAKHRSDVRQACAHANEAKLE